MHDACSKICMSRKHPTEVQVRQAPPDCHKILRKGAIVEGVKLHYVFGLRELFDRLAAEHFDKLRADKVIAQAKGVDPKTGLVYKLTEFYDGQIRKAEMGFREPTEDELKERNADALERFRQWKAAKNGSPTVDSKQQTKTEGDHHGNEEKSGGQKSPQSQKRKIVLGC
jgi:hypothetical protein